MQVQTKLTARPDLRSARAQNWSSIQSYRAFAYRDNSSNPLAAVHPAALPTSRSNASIVV